MESDDRAKGSNERLALYVHAISSSPCSAASAKIGQTRAPSNSLRPVSRRRTVARDAEPLRAPDVAGVAAGETLRTTPAGACRLETRGLGDRWLAGDAIEGVTFAQHDAVSIVEGPHSGETGDIMLLTGNRPQPTYLVELGSGRGTGRVRHSELRPRGG